MIEEKRCDKCSSLLGDSAGCPFCLLELGVSGAGQQRAGLGELPSLAELNNRFPQLEISRLIGRGGMGAIYQARQTSLDRDVALKLIAKEVSQDPLFVERFEREAKTLAKLSHPNIVTVYDFGYTSDGVAYLMMEYVDGINLREAIASRSVGPEDALEVVSTVCRALEYAHSKGVIHRDIKPENILLSEDGSLRLSTSESRKLLTTRFEHRRLLRLGKCWDRCTTLRPSNLSPQSRWTIAWTLCSGGDSLRVADRRIAARSI